MRMRGRDGAQPHVAQTIPGHRAKFVDAMHVDDEAAQCVRMLAALVGEIVLNRAAHVEARRRIQPCVVHEAGEQAVDRVHLANHCE